MAGNNNNNIPNTCPSNTCTYTFPDNPDNTSDIFSKEGTSVPTRCTCSHTADTQNYSQDVSLGGSSSQANCEIYSYTSDMPNNVMIDKNIPPLNKEAWENIDTEFLNLNEESWNNFRTKIVDPTDFMTDLNTALAEYLKANP